MVLDDNDIQIGIELACRKPMNTDHDENKTAKQIYLLDIN